MRRFCPIPETKPTPGPTQTIRILGLADLGFKGVILELPICLKDDVVLQKHFLAALKYLVKIYSIFTQKSLQFKVMRINLLRTYSSCSQSPCESLGQPVFLPHDIGWLQLTLSRPVQQAPQGSGEKG